MRVLVACEFSGVVRDAFATLGHDAWSCDMLPSERPGNHLQGSVLKWLSGKPQVVSTLPFEPWDLMIAFPPCTHLAVSGARWFKYKQVEQLIALEFVCALLNANIPRICIENPIGIIPSRIRPWRDKYMILHEPDKRNRLRPSQTIQPWQFGHGETKATCLWLKNLPPLVPTDIVSGRAPRVHFASPGPDRWKERSRTLPGIAKAMAEQWGIL